MKLFENGARSKRASRNATMALALLVAASLMALMLARASGAAATAVQLGGADSFAILAGAGITNTGPTTVNGDIGTFATTSFTGSASVTQTGTNHAGDTVTQDAKNALVTAYNDAAAQGPTTPIVGLTLGGKTLTRGVYNSGSTIDLTGTVTLDAQGDPDSVFVLQAGSALTTATSSSVALINGASACNVFWQIGSDATLGVGSTFVGTLLVQNSIVLDTGAVVSGRVLASVGSVTLDTNTIAKPSCATHVARALYCNGTTAYDLVVGQDKVAPYAALGLTPAFVDPATGISSCIASTPPTATTTTTTTTTTTAPTATTPTPAGPTAKQIAAAKAKRAAVAKAKRIAAATSQNIVKKTPKPKPKPPVVQSFGFTG
jgi:type VI secretion system secreted protein VgrG